MQKKITVISVSTSDVILLSSSDILTFAAVGDQSDYVVAAEVRLTDNGNWFVMQAAMTDGEIYSTVSGVVAVRFDLTDLGTAATVDIEISGADM